MGSFRLTLSFWNLHQKFNFTKIKKMTANESLRFSCRTTINSQEISLHYHSQEKTVICQAFQKKQIHFFCYFTNIGQSSNHIHFFENSHDSRFLTNSRSLHFTMNLLIYLKSKVRFYTEVTILICRVPFFLLI